MLGIVQSLVRTCVYGIHIIVRMDHGAANADGNCTAKFIYAGGLCDGSVYALAELGDKFIGGNMIQIYAEFITAKPSHEIRTAYRGLQSASEDF